MTYEPRGGIFSRRSVSFLVILAVLGLGIGIGTLINHGVVAVGPGDSQLKIQSKGATPAAGTALMLSEAFEQVANRVGPAVVNINTEEIVRLSRSGGRGQVPDMFRQFFPETPQEYTQSSLGSGILVDPKGYIITNNHVVQDASKIKVNLKDGREYKARVIAGDDLSDIAVIKIDGEKEFPFVPIGDAKAMKVGDWVLAIGSPFGLEQTVTAGIISATGRVFDESQGSLSMLFNDYLQTDAAINPGNSGGPLVNLNGEVIGINSFIQTASRNNAGVGFAVPSHIFVDVYNQILENGKVRRGWLGVTMNTEFPFTPAMAEYFGVKQGRGVLITGLNDQFGNPSEDTPAAKAGIKAEDVIIEFDGKKIYGVQDLRLAVANTPPGRRVDVKAVRFGAIKDYSVTLAERTYEANQQQAAKGFNFDEKQEPKQEIGMVINNVPSRVARQLNITGGALVVTVSPGSLAEEAGLQSQDQGGYDIIVAANGKNIEVYQDMVDILKELKSGQSVVIKLLRVGVGPNGPVPSTFFTSLTKP